jgi:RNA polymerase sigma-70 factor (ECF subfamily)
LSDPDPRSDAELVAAAGAGDVQAFESLYHRHRDWTVALAYRFTGDRDLALDVLQDTFAYLLRRLPAIRLHARLTTFLYPVVKHTAQQARRKNRRGNDDPSAMAEAASPEAPPPDSHASMIRAVADLSESHREVVLMRFVSDMTLAEIAFALGVPVGTVKSRLHHALGRLARSG